MPSAERSGARPTARGCSSSTQRSDTLRGRRAEPARATSQAWWAALEALRCPVLLVRGAESDILSPEIAASMETRQPRLRRVDVEGVGHAPTLAKPIAAAALDAFYLAET